MNAHPRIVPVILSGGVGSRLWPLSRRARPKQFASLDGAHSMIQDTALRFVGPSFGPPVVVTHADQAMLVREQLAEVGAPPLVVLKEPRGRNTGPAAMAAAAYVAQTDPKALVLLINADNRASDPSALHRAIAMATPAALAGRIVLFGVRPTGPETIYGYIRAADGEGVREIEAFEEKPDRARAERYVRDPNYLWNGGMVLMRVDAFLDEARRVAPQAARLAEEAVRQATARDGEVALGPAFLDAPAEAIDTAVFEKTDKASVVLADFGWADVGTWTAIWAQASRDSDGNAIIGDGHAVQSHGNLVMSDGPSVVLAGVEGLAVIVHGGAVLVVPRDSDAAMRGAQAVLETAAPDLL